MRHIIKRHTLQFDFDNNLDVFGTQQEMDQFNKEMILPALERIFDEISEEEKIVAIDKIEIDLGLINIADIKTKGATGLYETILSQFRKSFYSNKPSISTTPAGISRVVSVAAQWLFYMQHGYLPWNTIQTNSDWYYDALEAFAVEFESAAALRQLIITNEYARMRIVHQHDERFLRQLIEVLTTEKQNEVLQYADELTKIILAVKQAQDTHSAVKLTSTKEKAWTLLLIGAAKKERNIVRGGWATKILGTLIKNKQIAVAVTNDLQDQLEIALPLMKEIITERQLLSEERLQQLNDKKDIDEGKAGKKGNNENEQRKTGLQTDKDLKSLLSEDDSIMGDKTDKIQNENIEIENIISDPERTIIKEQNLAIDTEGIFIVNAGIVLLHPFLNQFFKKLQLIQHKDFISKDAQQKALYLLHYLATGNAVAEEHELLIAKLLCAYSFEDTVPKAITVNEAETAEADQLIEAAISQWSILQNISPAGLREGFLQRKGKLYKKNEDLYLQIEAASIDMLLDHLPWNLSMIKLPWMKEMLRVEWR